MSDVRSFSPSESEWHKPDPIAALPASPEPMLAGRHVWQWRQLEEQMRQQSPAFTGWKDNILFISSTPACLVGLSIRLFCSSSPKEKSAAPGKENGASKGNYDEESSTPVK